MAADTEDVIPIIELLQRTAESHSQLSPSIDLSSTAAHAYLSRLSTYTLPSLLSEPSLVAEESAQLAGEITNLCFREYKTFIDVHRCGKEVGDALEEFNHALDELSLAVPALEEECRAFSDSTRGIQSDRRRSKAVQDHQDKLQDLLDIPQLVDACVRNGYYQEAMELSAHAQFLSKRYPDVPIVTSVRAEVSGIMRLQSSQLLALLREPVKLPTLVRTIGFLRRMGDLTEPELRLTFLTSREHNFQAQLEHLERDRADGIRYTRRYVDLFRENVYDTVSQYASIFLDSLGSTAKASIITTTSKEGSIVEDDREDALDLVVIYANHAVDGLLHVIDRNVPLIGDTSSLSSLLTQLGYCAMSFSRVGMDFAPMLVRPFEDAVLAIIHKGFEDASAVLRSSFEHAVKGKVAPGRWLCTPDALVAIMAAENSPPADDITNTSTQVPSQSLSAHPPLALYMNANLSTLNSLRLLAPLNLFGPISTALHTSLTSAIQAFSSYAATALSSPVGQSAQPPRARGHTRTNTTTGVIQETAPSEEVQAGLTREAKRVLVAYASAFDVHVQAFLRMALMEVVYDGAFGKVDSADLGNDFTDALMSLRRLVREHAQGATLGATVAEGTAQPKHEEHDAGSSAILENVTAPIRLPEIATLDSDADQPISEAGEVIGQVGEEIETTQGGTAENGLAEKKAIIVDPSAASVVSEHAEERAARGTDEDAPVVPSADVSRTVPAEPKEDAASNPCPGSVDDSAPLDQSKAGTQE